MGTAQIARKNWRSIRNSGNGTVVAVASRDRERSRQFIRECQAEAPMETAPAALGGYEEMLASKAIEAVYIPLPTALRKEWVLRAAAAGKHVLCEKPCAICAADLREMVEACRRQNVQFMDGVMFMHSRRLERLREMCEDADGIGQIRRIVSGFSYCAGPEFFAGNIRGDSALEPHGCVGDLGWYCIRLALWAMKWQMPRQVSGRVLSEYGRGGKSAPVPTEFSAELVFDGGVSAGFYCSFVAENQQWAAIGGARGYLRLEDFVLPFTGKEIFFEVRRAEFRVRGGDFEMIPRVRRVAVEEPSHGSPQAQESNLFRNFSRLVRSGRVDPLWPDISLKTQQVMDACLESAARDGRAVVMT
jgi:predicted dehydrogenase